MGSNPTPGATAWFSSWFSFSAGELFSNFVWESTALREMTLNDDRFLVVVDRDERPVGYVSLSDLVKA